MVVQECRGESNLPQPPTRDACRAPAVPTVVPCLTIASAPRPDPWGWLHSLLGLQDPLTIAINASITLLALILAVKLLLCLLPKCSTK